MRKLVVCFVLMFSLIAIGAPVTGVSDSRVKTKSKIGGNRAQGMGGADCFYTEAQNLAAFDNVDFPVPAAIPVENLSPSELPDGFAYVLIGSTGNGYVIRVFRFKKTDGFLPETRWCPTSN